MTVNEHVTLNQSEAKNVGRDLLSSKTAINLRLGGYSMYPNLLPGDIATIEKVEPASLELGQVLVVEIESRWIAHRLVALKKIDGEMTLQTHGDSVIRPDAWLPSSRLIGVARKVVRNEKAVSLPSSVSLIFVSLRPLPQIMSRIVLKLRNKFLKLF